MKDSILVTGATGNVGKEVVSLLTGNGLTVKAAVRDLTNAKSAILNDVETVLFDYDKPETFEHALAGIGRLFLCPPLLDSGWPELVLSLIHLAEKNGVKHIVNLSQMGAEDDETLPLRLAEKHVENSGIAYTLLRPNWFMQNCNGFMLDGIRGQGGISVPAGDSKASLIDARDIAAVAVESLATNEHRNRAYTLTGGASLDHNEMARILSDESGKDIQYFPISDEEMSAAMSSAGATEHSIRMVINLYQVAKHGGHERISPNVANILGRHPITFEQYAHDYAECWT